MTETAEARLRSPTHARVSRHAPALEVQGGPELSLCRAFRPVTLDSVRGHRLHCVMLAWTVLWFGAILPGHERGAVHTPGWSARCARCVYDGDGPGNAQLQGDLPTDAPAEGPSQPDDRGNQRCCALCHFIGVLSVPGATFSCPPMLHDALAIRLSAPDAPAIENGPDAYPPRAPRFI